MDFYKVPIGFGMAPAVNEPAMNAYATMIGTQKQAIINKALNVLFEKSAHHSKVNPLPMPPILLKIGGKIYK